MNYLQTLPDFLLYFGLAIALLSSFVLIYLRVTPYPEVALIRAGNVAACLALLGAVLGFCLPLASAIAHSVSRTDVILWGGIALLIQIVLHRLMLRLLPEISAGIGRGETAHGLLLGGAALAVGVLNAACMTY